MASNGLRRVRVSRMSTIVASRVGISAMGRAVPDNEARRPADEAPRRADANFLDGVYYDEYRVGRTSLSSPIMADLMALADRASGTPCGPIANQRRIGAMRMHNVRQLGCRTLAAVDEMAMFQAAGPIACQHYSAAPGSPKTPDQPGDFVLHTCGNGPSPRRMRRPQRT
jgi:hypothetical protein